MAGRLRHLITIQAQSTTQDAVGQQTIAWTTVTTAWADIEPVSGRDYFNASGEHAEITHKITLRYGVTVRAGDRLVLGTRTFDVRSVLTMNERNAYLNLMVVEDAG